MLVKCVAPQGNMLLQCRVSMAVLWPCHHSCSWNKLCWAQCTCKTSRTLVYTMPCSVQDPLLPFLLLAPSSGSHICAWLTLVLCETWLEANSNCNSLRAPGTNFSTAKMYQSPVKQGRGMRLCSWLLLWFCSSYLNSSLLSILLLSFLIVMQNRFLKLICRKRLW